MADYSIVPAEALADAASEALEDADWGEAVKYVKSLSKSLPPGCQRPSIMEINCIHAARSEVADTLEGMANHWWIMCLNNEKAGNRGAAEALAVCGNMIRRYAAALRASLEDGTVDPTMEGE